ncbi:ribonuclease H [Salmonella phage STML-198]|uniref:Ribonuclease H n=1 Tax=Salmonella phage STML-198 TaxID=1204531 RepID=K4I2J9_9CAUD|nr:ribonuclease H [Salmonella phage STML-198]AFU63928.1 ribonuclease H [Salmonella phage STML-198]
MSNLDCLFGEEDQTKEGIVLVDLSQIALAAALNTFSDKEKIQPSMMRHLVLSTLKKNVLQFRKQGYEKVIICADNAKSGYWRRDIAYYYKKNRKQGREESTWDWEGYFTGIRTIIDEFQKYMPYTVMNIDKYEADDHIGILVPYLSLKGHKIMIVSSDGDFKQLHRYPNVKQWSPMQKKFVVCKTGDAELECLTKVLKGDRKDNIASVKVRSDFWYTKIDGERTPSFSTKLLEQCLDAGPEGMKTLLTEAEYNRYLENRVLIDFSYIPEEIAKPIIEYYELYKTPPRGKIYSYFVKSGLSKLTNRINEF